MCPNLLSEDEQITEQTFTESVITFFVISHNSNIRTFRVAYKANGRLIPHSPHYLIGVCPLLATANYTRLF